MQEEKIRQVVSLYTKIPASQLFPDSVIDRTTIASSILVHRMYADLAKEGFEVAGYWDIKDYGSLVHRLGLGNGAHEHSADTVQVTRQVNIGNLPFADTEAVGIDLEERVAMPAAIDFREDEFYTKYFSASEIAYCILQPDPLISFAGLFAAKEAIVKANNQFRKQAFNAIVIDHLPGGKPIHPAFYVSITHTATLAVAVAVQKNLLNGVPSTPSKTIIPPPNNTFLYVVSFSAIILAITCFILIILRP